VPGAAPRPPFPVGHRSAIRRAGPGKTIDYAYAEQVQTELTAMIQAAFAAREALGTVHFFIHTRIGNAAEEVLLAARELSADMIVVGSHGHTGMKRLLLGSVSERIVREAECPVIVARPKTYAPVKLLDVVSVAPHVAHYVAPHRYSYQDTRVTRRPNDWPLY
jgi:nucleotide-binding universal stress UspA family protein